MDKPGAVYDCNVYLQALINPVGPAGRCVAAALDGRVRLFTSRMGAAELRDVANRPEIREKFPSLTPDRIETLVQTVEAAATDVARAVPEHFTYTRDLDDAHYVDLAVYVEASWLVTSDKDLLDLMTDHSIEGKQFRQLTRNQLRVVTPAHFLGQLPPAPSPAA